MERNYHRLRLVLGDQLNENHAWYQQPDEQTLYVLMETRSETTYVRHHIQKVVAFFLAMRAFASRLEEKGCQVVYLRLDDADNRQDIAENLKWLIGKYQPAVFEYQQPDEYRLDRVLKEFCASLSIESQIVESEHFLTSRTDLGAFFRDRKSYLMEHFYRMMRKKFDILMEADGESPLMGRWNFDAENRNRLSPEKKIPAFPSAERETGEIVELLNKFEIKTIGRIDPDRFPWPVTREEYLELLEHFATVRLPDFGTYQDAMSERDSFLFHSRLSFGLNVKLLSPLEVVQRVVREWESNKGRIDIAQVEGFVRQIIGWREYMRGIYWEKMPEYAQLNYFAHDAPLPQFFWTGKTRMNCLKHAIGQSLDHAYAHHIQRLMITGNFALLLGVDPDELDDWYLGIYIDAIEWVEITNTRGMSQFADGGIVGTKPYVSSANYIDKMSDYCANCHYFKTKKYGDKACPFNSLYWDFYHRNSEKLRGNPRVGMMYRVWERMDASEREKILKQASAYKNSAEEL